MKFYPSPTAKSDVVRMVASLRGLISWVKSKVNKKILELMYMSTCGIEAIQNASSWDAKNV